VIFAIAKNVSNHGNQPHLASVILLCLWHFFNSKYSLVYFSLWVKTINVLFNYSQDASEGVGNHILLPIMSLLRSFIQLSLYRFMMISLLWSYIQLSFYTSMMISLLWSYIQLSFYTSMMISFLWSYIQLSFYRSMMISLLCRFISDVIPPTFATFEECWSRYFSLLFMVSDKLSESCPFSRSRNHVVQDYASLRVCVI
jgi:hypothetical protein